MCSPFAVPKLARSQELPGNFEPRTELGRVGAFEVATKDREAGTAHDRTFERQRSWRELCKSVVRSPMNAQVPTAPSI